MDKKLSHKRSESTFSNVKRPIERLLCWRLVFFISLVTVLVGIASYFHSLASTEELVREQLIKYIGERGLRESALFLESDAYQLRFQKEYVERYKRTGDEEAMGWLSEHMEKRPEDGTYRSKPELYHGKDMPLGRRDVAATMMIGAKTEITPQVLKALAIGYDMVNQYGPAWRKPFDDLYFSAPEKISVSRWPGTPWGLMMDDKVDWRDEEWFAITTIAKNQQREQRWSGVLYDERNGNWMVSGVTPLDIDGKQVGMVGTDLLLDDIVDRTINDTLTGTYNILMQADGRIIAHPHKIKEIIASKGMLMAQDLKDEHLQHIYEHAQAVTNFPHVIDHKDADEFIAVTQIQGPDWYFITVYPKSLLIARAWRNAGFIFLSGMISLVVMFLVIWFVIRRNLVYPLSGLIQAVRDFEIPRGKWSGRSDEFLEKASTLSTRPDELGLLASSFVDMSSNLRTAYDQLQTSEEKYRQVTEGIETILWEYDIPKDCWTYVSPQSQRLLGYAPEEWTGLSFWTEHIHEDDRQWTSKYCSECTARGESHDFEYRFLKKNGEVVWLRDIVNIEMNGSTPVKMRGFMSDITDRKKAEEEVLTKSEQLQSVNRQLSASEQQLRASNQQLLSNEQQLKASNQQLRSNEQEREKLLHSMDERIKEIQCLYAVARSIRTRNTKEETLQDIAELIPGGWHYPEITRGKIIFDGKEYVSEPFEETEWKLSTDIVVSDELRGTIAVYYIKECPELDEGPFMTEERNLINGIARIISEAVDRKQAEHDRERLVKILEYKNRELQDIVYTTSHDLRSPLVNIEGFSGELYSDCDRLIKMLSDQDDGVDRRQQIEILLKENIPESLSFIASSAKKMARLLDGLLQISRVGTVEIKSKSVDINKMISEVLAATEHQIKECNISVVVETLADCIGDPNMVNQVFSNLIGNAIKYCDPVKESEIKISGRVEGDMSIYCVEDNGIGIDPGHQNKVFEIFHRLDPDKDVEGEGLGLTIVTRVMDRLGGEIWLESEPDKGSKFYIALPVCDNASMRY